ncbi:hypothetical protein NX059_002777 [Plenodomus lindquistii]|nr:hypothetical protein NX059_002777 [Plenodomus lindquistii]
MNGLVGAPAFKKKTFDNPSADKIGTIVAIFEIGAFLGAVTTAIIGETLGRRNSVFKQSGLNNNTPMTKNISHAWHANYSTLATTGTLLEQRRESDV